MENVPLGGWAGAGGTPNGKSHEKFPFLWEPLPKSKIVKKIAIKKIVNIIITATITFTRLPIRGAEHMCLLTPVTEELL